MLITARLATSVSMSRRALDRAWVSGAVSVRAKGIEEEKRAMVRHLLFTHIFGVVDIPIVWIYIMMNEQCGGGGLRPVLHRENEGLAVNIPITLLTHWSPLIKPTR